MTDVANVTEERAVRSLKEEAEINESYVIGLLWNNPSITFPDYINELEDKHFTQPSYRFFYTLGRLLLEKNIKVFDDITILKSVNELGDQAVQLFEKYGGLKTIKDLVEIAKGGEGNLDHYIENIKRTRVLFDTYMLVGGKAIIETSKYPLSQMTGRDISAYWLDKFYKLQTDTGSSYEAQDLGMSAEMFFEELEQEQEDMLPYYGLHNLQYAIGGIPRGHMTMLGGFGGTGKSTLTAYTVISSLLETPDEKAVVILNEENAMSFRKKVAMLLVADKVKKANPNIDIKVDRKRLNQNRLTDTDKEAITHAINTMNELLGDAGRIKTVFVERYIMKEVETIIRRFANRGYNNLIIDTHKVSEESQYNARWETFVEDMKTYYRLTRKEAGGLNLRTFVTFQLADSAIHNRYLDFEAIGEGKAAKNEASVVIMFRKLWASEYPNGKQALRVYRKEKSKIAGKNAGKYVKEVVPLDPNKIYYLIFVPKNRFGQSNDTGLPVMVVETDFNYGRFFDVGWTNIADDKSR